MASTRPTTRAASKADASVMTKPAAEVEESTEVVCRGLLTLGETDAYDAPAAAPRLHLALGLVAVLPLLLDVPANAAIVATPTLTILAGAWRSVKSSPPTETMTQSDAMRFPIVGSCFLFGLFLLFKFFNKDLINAVLTAYFVFLGLVAVSVTLAPFAADAMPRRLARRTLSLGTLKLPSWVSDPMELTASVPELCCGALAALLCTWYVAHKHWLANNALGLAFSLQGLEHISLGSTQNGALLLCGLFLYDVFWVFCTPVMVSVAKSFDAPIKLLFPRPGNAAAAAASIAASVVEVVHEVADAKPSKPFNMLGLGDIVIPGIFLALMLRMDVARAAAAPKKGPKPARYFQASVVGYALGLGTTIGVMNVWNAAQPALLYIVPAVLGAVLGRAALLGEFMAVLHWSEEAEDKSGSEGEQENAEGWVKLSNSKKVK